MRWFVIFLPVCGRLVRLLLVLLVAFLIISAVGFVAKGSIAAADRLVAGKRATARIRWRRRRAVVDGIVGAIRQVRQLVDDAVGCVVGCAVQGQDCRATR